MKKVEEIKKITPIIIGICGGTASGKTSVCKKIIESFENEKKKVVIISQDCFYKNLTLEAKENSQKYNFDHPDAFDWELIEESLMNLKSGKPTQIPEYDFVTHSRLLDKSITVSNANIILFEGILVFHNAKLRQYMDMKIFVDTDADTRLARRVLRDINERGRELTGILYQYETFVKPAFDSFILPSKRFADVIIPRGSDNIVAINLLVHHIRTSLHEMLQQETKILKNKKLNLSGESWSQNI